MKREIKINEINGGDFAAAALGLLDGDEAVQPSFLEVDPTKHQARAQIAQQDRDYGRRAVVYFVQEVSAEGYIKIGYSNQFAVRLSQIKVNNPRELKVLALIDGNRELEDQLHRRFDDHRVCGDWFRPAQEILGFAATADDSVKKEFELQMRERATRRRGVFRGDLD